MTAGRGPDACIDAVGMEAHGKGLLAAYDRLRQMMGIDTDRPLVLREVMRHCRNGGTISVPGVYGGLINKVPMGSVMNRALTIKPDRRMCSAICNRSWNAYGRVILIPSG
jgi:threonine dehydrogenase-like Zn-dependent dehydrogenase